MAINADINGVIAKTVGNRIAFACGTTTPAAGSVGHEHGALFLNQNDGLYVNVGTQASCDFRAVVTNNPDTAYGVIDCVATLGMQGGVADADENSTKLQDSLTADAYPYPYQVSGMFRLGTTVNVDRTAHKFAGTGMHRSSATSSVGTLYGTPSGFISHSPRAACPTASGTAWSSRGTPATACRCSSTAFSRTRRKLSAASWPQGSAAAVTIAGSSAGHADGPNSGTSIGPPVVKHSKSRISVDVKRHVRGDMVYPEGL